MSNHFKTSFKDDRGYCWLTTYKEYNGLCNNLLGVVVVGQGQQGNQGQTDGVGRQEASQG